MSKLTQLFGRLSIVLLFFSTVLHAQEIEVTATVDKNPVMADESFNLVVVANGDVDRGDFDSSILAKDFVVGRTSVSSQTQMINFTTSKSTTWTTVLIPRKQGRFTIPAFEVAGSKTQPISLMVVPVSASTNSAARDLFITTSVDVEKVYLQQQIHYTVKLHLAKDLQRGSLSSPTLENADIRQIGKDKEYNDIVDGKRYRIIERSFAIIPQQSGTFVIEGPLFEGEVIDNSRQSFGFFNRNKAVNRVGPNQTIEVLPVPANYSQHWLPSEFVQVDDEWQNSDKGFVAGEPITRTITLTALGVIEQQLPNINSQYPDTVKTYPDQAETTTVEKDNTLIAQRKESIAIIPSQAGSLVIPEVKIPWFNTLTQKTEYALLPEKTIQILPAVNQPTTATIPLAPVQKAETDISIPKAVTTPVMVSGVEQYWQWIAFSLLALWLLTLTAWWIHTKRFTKTQTIQRPSEVRTTESEKVLWKNLEKALNNHNALDSQTQLNLWLANIIESKNATLDYCLQKLQQPALNDQVNYLLAARYSAEKNAWKSNELHSLLRSIRKARFANANVAPPLKPLYPVN
ncbi:BatD family protein [Paraglaciecola aquimarina]|uniref:BatD family protein n=1 Tax=Paraglaciecola aquimarina TaxID=1235557 RepID=A0ABU3SZU8_9ALTE|nr:BatD family protein [Paraglaciecola aquimarina]MDU0355520.1 BatD family protein [Paraglaciecola aquimarina]